MPRDGERLFMEPIDTEMDYMVRAPRPRTSESRMNALLILPIFGFILILVPEFEEHAFKNSGWLMLYASNLLHRPLLLIARPRSLALTTQPILPAVGQNG